MQISLHNTGKRYNREWIFRKVDYVFEPNLAYAITGPNGSGKSTLLQVIAGALQHNSGSLTYTTTEGKQIEEPYAHLAFAAPYLDLIEEMTATEFLNFHEKFKPLTHSIPAILKEVNLENAADKQIRYFSSGMKQRLKLAQAFFTNAPVLLLDEPTSNLDKEGINLYRELIKGQQGKKLIIISSNDVQEYDFCNEVIDIVAYK